MPLYEYRCPDCGSRFEELRKMDERATCQCECGATANMVITPVRFDWQKMGLDPDFATFSDKWANIQTRKNTGLTKTQNETYGGLDTDKIRHENKKKFTG